MQINIKGFMGIKSFQAFWETGTRSLNGNKAVHVGNFVLTSLLLYCKSTCSYANYLAFYLIKWQRSSSKQAKSRPALLAFMGKVTKHTTVKWSIMVVKSSPRMMAAADNMHTENSMFHTLYLQQKLKCTVSKYGCYWHCSRRCSSHLQSVPNIHVLGSSLE